MKDIMIYVLMLVLLVQVNQGDMIMLCMILSLNMDPHTTYYKVQCATFGRLRIRLQETDTRINLRDIKVVCNTEMQQTVSDRVCREILVPLMLDLEYSLSFCLSLCRCVFYLSVCLVCLLACSQNSHSRGTFF
jgi:hypothetical protein